MKKYFMFLLFCLSLLACKDRDDFMAYSSEKVVKKYFVPDGGTWKIKELKVWIVEPDHRTVHDEITVSDIGEITFRKDNTLDFTLNNGTVDLTYLNLYSSTATAWDYLGGTLTIGKGYGKENLYNVLSVNKKEMVLFSSAVQNLYQTNKILLWKNVEFQYKLEKKK